VPGGRDVTFDDVVRGAVTVSTATIGDPVLLRSDGTPAYNFAVVIDDALMAITHVVRGEDHISNTPRQLLLYEAFGWRPPVFAHVSLVMGPDHSPLSKRHGATSVAEFRARGVLPEALVNYLALLGWSPGGDLEQLPLDELARRFRLEDVGQSAGVFDPGKLAWFNRQYLREVSPDRLVRLAVPYLQRRQWLDEPTEGDMDYLAEVLPPVVSSVDTVEQVPERLAFLFDYSAARALAVPELRAEALAARPVVEALAEELDGAAPLVDRETFRAAASRVGKRTGTKGRALLHPIRLVLTGEGQGLELDEAVPAIERGARLRASGLRPIPSAAARAAAVARLLGST
jgi:glutamyl-tRNA synthetase